MNLSNVTDSKKIWKTTKPLLSDKSLGKSDITLIEGNEIYQEDSKVANILGDYFSNAVKTLNINVPSEYKDNKSAVSDDPIDRTISQFSKHPSIIVINENVEKGNFRFHAVGVADMEREINALDGTKSVYVN